MTKLRSGLSYAQVRISPPGWQVRQKLVSRPRALISEMAAPQAGQGLPPLPCTDKKLRTSRWISVPTRSRSVAMASRSTDCVASYSRAISSSVSDVRLR